MKTIIKYIGIALVIVGILLVMKNLVTKDTSLTDKSNNKEKYYTVSIKLLNKDTNDYIEGSKLVLKDKNNKLVDEWTTTNNVHTISKLEKGKYILSQVSASKNYHLNEETITFEIKDKNRNVTMYNTPMTEEEIKDANTTKTDINVDNTASSKSILTIIVSLITTFVGLGLIYRVKKNY